MLAGIEYGLSIGPDRLLMLEEESYTDEALAARLMPIALYKPQFIAIIGYSFAWMGGRNHNDRVSLDCLIDHYRHFVGPVYVVEPQPERLQEYLAERLHWATVIGLRARWNLLAHAFLMAQAGRLDWLSLTDFCERLVDEGHANRAFPLPADI